MPEQKGNQRLTFNVPLLGNLNESGRPDLISDFEVTECQNYYFDRDGILRLRPTTEAFTDAFVVYIQGGLEDDDDIELNLRDLAKQIWVWKSPHLTKDSKRNYLLLLQTRAGDNVTSDLWLLECFTAEGGWRSVYSGQMFGEPLFRGLGKDVRIAMQGSMVMLVDGRDGSVVRRIEISPSGELSFGEFGELQMQPPLSIASFSKSMIDNSWSDQESFDKGMSIERGSILFLCYTTVTEIGEESNPSPMSVFSTGQYLALGEDMELKDWYQRAIAEGLRTFWADSHSNEHPTRNIKYFNVYMGSVVYSEGFISRGAMHRARRIDISDIYGDNRFVSTTPFTGAIAEYGKLNDLRGDDICVSGGIAFVSNATTRIRFPFNFDRYFRITVSNRNSRNYVEPAIWIKLYEKDLVDEDGNELVNWSEWFSGNFIFPEKLHQLRIYDQDLTTPIPVLYKRHSPGLPGLNIVIKLPYLEAQADHDIYLCMGGEGVPTTQPGGSQINLNSSEYGKWDCVDVAGEFKQSKVFTPPRVKNQFCDVCVDMEHSESPDIFHIFNRANRNLDFEHYLIGQNRDILDNYPGMFMTDPMNPYSALPNSTHPINNYYHPFYSESLSVDGEKQEEYPCILLQGLLGSLSASHLSIPFPAKGYMMMRFRIWTKHYEGDLLTGDIIQWGNDDDYFKLCWTVSGSRDTIGFSLRIKSGNQNETRVLHTMSRTAVEAGVSLLFSWDKDGPANEKFYYHFTNLKDFQTQGNVWWHTSGTTSCLSSLFPDIEEYWYIVRGPADLPDPPPASREEHNLRINHLYVERDTAIFDDATAKRLKNFYPYFPEEHIGFDEWTNPPYGENKNITIYTSEPVQYAKRKGIIHYSGVGGYDFPALNNVVCRDDIVRIIPAPSYLQDGSYMNTIVVFGEDWRQRLLLRYEQGKWLAHLHELLMDERVHYGLPKNCADTLIRVSNTLFWLSNNRLIKEDINGQVILNMKDGIVTLRIETDGNKRYMSFYDPINNQIFIDEKRELYINKPKILSDFDYVIVKEEQEE